MKLLKHSYVIILLLATGCANLWSQGSKEKLPGERIDAIQSPMLQKPDASHRLQLPAPQLNQKWSSLMLGNQLQNPSLGSQLAPSLVLKVGSVPSALGFITIPVVAEGTIFALDPNGEVVAFDWDTGNKKWGNKALQELNKFELWSGQYYSGGLLYHNGTVYITGGSGNVLAVEAASGKTKWMHKLNALSRAVPIVAGGHLVIQTLDGSAYGLNLDNGQINWLYPGSSSDVSVLSATYPVSNGDAVFFQFSSNTVIAYDSARKSELWGHNLIDIDTQDLDVGDGATVYTPVYNSGVLYVYSKSHLFALDASNSNRLWKIHAVVAAPITLAGDAIYAIIRSGNIHSLVAIHKNNGAIAWAQDLTSSKASSSLFNAPFIAGNMVGVSDNHGTLHWFDAINGQTKGEMLIDSGTYSRPIVVNGALVVTSSNGSITRYQEVQK